MKDQRKTIVKSENGYIYIYIYIFRNCIDGGPCVQFCALLSNYKRPILEKYHK